MVEFNRNWTIVLQTTNENFSNNFYNVVMRDNKFVRQTLSVSNRKDIDFFGSIRNNTFTIWKRKGIFDPNPGTPALNGEIVDNENNITLKLSLSSNFAFNYIKIFVRNIIITAIFFFITTRLLVTTNLFSIKLNTTYFIVTVPPLFILAYFLQKALINKYLDWLADSYEDVLTQIERQSNLH